MIVLKLVILGISIVLTSPLIIIAKLEEWITGNENFFAGIGQFLALFPGKVGKSLRLGYYFCTLEKCAYDAYFGFGVLIPHRGTRIGYRVVIGAYSIIGTVTLEDDVLIASRVSIPSGKYQHVPEDEEKLITEAELKFSRIIIGKNTWIGEGALVLANVGENCTIAAGSVVMKDVKPNCKVAGNPARVIEWKK